MQDFPWQWLQFRFCAYILTYFGHEVCCKVSYFVVSHCCHSAHGASEGMLHCESLSIHTQRDMFLACWADSMRTTEQQHPGKLLCTERTQTQQLAEQANWKYPSHLQDRLLASWCAGLGLWWFLITSSIHLPISVLLWSMIVCTSGYTIWICVLPLGQFLWDIDVGTPNSCRVWEDLPFALIIFRTSCHSLGEPMSDGVFQGS